MLNLEIALLEDLTAELEVTDGKFEQKLLIPKLRNAIREVRAARKYPKHYRESMIEDDMQEYYSNIRSIALYDYNKAGAEYETGHSENSVSRSWEDRKTLFSGIIPLSRI